MAGQLKVLVGELREQHARLRETLESMPDGVIALDADGKIETINSIASQLCGLEGDGAVGKSLLEATMHYGLAAVAGEAAREGKASQELRFGRSGDIVVSATAVRREAASGVTEVVLLLHDRTEEDRLSQVRSEFIADASHELRTPVAGMRALAETLQLSRQAGKEMSKELFDELEREATRLGELVNDLLDLAAIEAGTRSFSKVPVELGHLLSDLHNAHKAKLQEKNINCRLEPCGLSIATDARALLQILGNILDNAIRHTPHGKTIYITAERVGQWCEIAIRDEGEGIEPGDLCRIFERFYRSQKARDRETGGTGLGLSIAKHLALALGGSIEAASTPGEGSTFVVRLPLD
jgi:two-component system phosphate regulon sensor histidine kinase PhoR